MKAENESKHSRDERGKAYRNQKIGRDLIEILKIRNLCYRSFPALLPPISHASAFLPSSIHIHPINLPPSLHLSPRSLLRPPPVFSPHQQWRIASMGCHPLRGSSFSTCKRTPPNPRISPSPNAFQPKRGSIFSSDVTIPSPPRAPASPPRRGSGLPTPSPPLKRQDDDPDPISPQSKKQRDEEPTKQPVPRDEDQKEEEEEDDGVACAVCRSTDGDPVDPIVSCDGCDLMVHATCYGNPLIKSIPEGDWFCLRCCERKGEKKPSCCCCLCPVEGGAVKPTTDGRWAHIICALLVPEAFFRDPQGRDAIDCSRVPSKRRSKDCYICGSNLGCAIQCSEPKCGLGFHVSCGLDEGLSIEYKEGRGGAIVAGFCVDHTRLWEKQQLTGKFKIVPRENEPKGKTRA